ASTMTDPSRTFLRHLPHPPPNSLFFQYAPHHRDLHSFPTRRSSDLLQSEARPGSTIEPGRTHGTPIWTPDGFAATLLLSGLLQRSEEHTSELQSRGHLVCRLLLEKKKKKRHPLQDHRRPAIVRNTTT